MRLRRYNFDGNLRPHPSTTSAADLDDRWPPNNFFNHHKTLCAGAPHVGQQPVQILRKSLNYKNVHKDFCRRLCAFVEPPTSTINCRQTTSSIVTKLGVQVLHISDYNKFKFYKDPFTIRASTRIFVGVSAPPPETQLRQSVHAKSHLRSSPKSNKFVIDS